MSLNTDDSLILDTETFAIAVAEAIAVIEADKAELFARSKREAATAIANAAAISIAIANTEADEAEKVAREKREAANAAATALYASKTMVESGFTEITVDVDEPTTVDASTAAGRTHASKAARKAERKAAMKAHYRSHKQHVKDSEILQQHIEEQRHRDYEIQQRAIQAELQMRVAVEIELRTRGYGGSGAGRGGGGGGGGGGGTNAGVVACFMAGT